MTFSKRAFNLTVKYKLNEEEGKRRCLFDDLFKILRAEMLSYRRKERSAEKAKLGKVVVAFQPLFLAVVYGLYRFFIKEFLSTSAMPSVCRE